METVILGWYVMVQTGSVLLLTTFGSLLLLGTLASPMFGVLGDRLGFRLMLSTMRAAYAALAALVLLLTLTGALTPRGCSSSPRWPGSCVPTIRSCATRSSARRFRRRTS